MCLPAALAAAPLFGGLTTVGGALQIASIGFGAISAIQSAQAANAQADYNTAVANNNAKLAEYQAEDAQRRGEEEAIAVQRKAAGLKSAQRATMAARGLDLTGGTPQGLLDQTDYFAQVDTGTVRSNADKEAYAKQVQASNSRTEAVAFQAGKRSPLMAGATSLLASASMVDSKWNTYKTPSTSYSWGGSSSSGLGLKAPSSW